MSRKADYKPIGKWVQVRRELPEVSGLVLPDISQVNDPDAMKVIVEVVGPDVDFTLEPGTELWLRPGVNAVGTLDNEVFFIQANDIVASVERRPELTL